MAARRAAFLPSRAEAERNHAASNAAVRYAYKQLVVPHLDMDLATKVMDAKWLDDADHRPVALRGDEPKRGR